MSIYNVFSVKTMALKYLIWLEQLFSMISFDIMWKSKTLMCLTVLRPMGNTHMDDHRTPDDNKDDE